VNEDAGGSRRMRWSVLAALAVMGGVAAGSTLLPSPALPAAGGTPPHLHPPGSGFGGYTVAVPSVTEIGATWAVPAVAPASARGYASTWVGVQNEAGGFVQLGTVEQRFPPAPPTYFAFWSDPGYRYEPQDIGAVAPGDRLSVQMGETARGWSLVLRDDTAGWSRTIAARADGGQFDQAEWVQEDPVASETAFVDTPYPTMSDVTIEDLTLDGRPPEINFERDASALTSPNGVELVPSAVRDDAFSLVAPSAPAATYLRDALSFNVAVSEFATGGPVPSQTAAGLPLARAIVVFDTVLARTRWQSPVAALVTRLIAHNHDLLADLQRWESAPRQGEAAAFTLVSRGFDENFRFAGPIRAALGLPPGR
jgi:hypothetical protein